MAGKTGKSGRIRVAVLYGGRSGEHEVSLHSAASVMQNLDPERYEIIPIGIDKQGQWHLHDLKMIANHSQSLPVYQNQPQVVMVPHQSGMMAPVSSAGQTTSPLKISSVDVVFPVLHGLLYEDGTLQGLLETANVPYVGSGVLSSALGMDKDVAKRMILQAGLDTVPYVMFRKESSDAASAHARAEKVAKEIGFPAFVKPANQGSSVGIHKVKTPAELEPAIQDAFQYDLKVLVEKGIDAREIEISVLENVNSKDDPLVSVVGEIIPNHEFYSYESKYLDENGARLCIPAEISPELAKEAQDLARKIFTTLECEGMARVDLFLDRKTGRLLFNEVNTLPGFTSISMYPKLWAATGLPYNELLSRLIDLALDRHARKNTLKREWEPAKKG